MKRVFVLPLLFFYIVGFHIYNSVGQTIGREDGDWQKCSEGSDLFNPPECPSSDLEFPVYFPFPYDCSQYYQCTNGVARCLKCAPGTLWDQAELVCNHPSAVTCSEVSTPPSLSTTNQPPTTIKDEAIGGPCPEGYSGLIVHPEKCEQFYLCDPGRPPCLFECPGNLCFNPDLEMCDSTGNIPQTRNRALLIHKTDADGNYLNYRNVNRKIFAKIVLYTVKNLKRNNLVFKDPCAAIQESVPL